MEDKTLIVDHGRSMLRLLKSSM